MEVKGMEKTVAVWYKGFLAQYKVSGGSDGVFNAELIRYDGFDEGSPPKQFPLHKEGRHWTDDDTNRDLLDDLGKAIEIQLYGTEQVANPRRYDNGRPRG
jgi:hypothetical protein